MITKYPTTLKIVRRGKIVTRYNRRGPSHFYLIAPQHMIPVYQDGKDHMINLIRDGKRVPKKIDLVTGKLSDPVFAQV